MDRKEAADLLDNLIGMIEDSHGADYDTALRMAINALSAQPDVSDTNVGDMVSRQAAIDAFNICVTIGRGNGKTVAFEAVNDYANTVIKRITALPSAQPEVTEEAVKEYCRKRCLCIVDSALLKKYASAQADVPDTNVGDMISRQAAISEFSCCELTPDGGIDANYAIDFLEQMPSAQPFLDEWCTDCSEYNSERHCCPRWNRVIRQAIRDAQPERKKMSNKEWVNFLSEQFTVSRTTAREMLHALMKWKGEDNFKKQFSGGKNEKK